MSGPSEPPKVSSLTVIKERLERLKQSSDLFDVTTQFRELQLDSEGNRVEGESEASNTPFDQPPPPPQPMALTIRQLSTSAIPPGGVPTCIIYPDAAEGKTANFELKSGLIHQLPTFYGLSIELPNKHLQEFQFICTSMKPQGADEQILKLKAFPFSLADRAKQWLYELPTGHITSWDDMMKAFLEKYFPTSRIITLRKELSGIQQGQDESYAEYFERFKSLITQCPQHGMKAETLLTCFYDGLTNLERDMLDAASGGSFVDKEPAEGMSLIQKRPLNQQQYGSSKSTRTREKVNEVSTLVQLEDKIDKLTSLVSQGMKGQVMACGVCSMQGHVSDQCPQLMDGGNYEGVNALGFQQGYQRPRNDPFSNTYNPGWRDHPNFRWKDNDNFQSAPQGFQQRPQGFYQKPQAPNPTPFNSNANTNVSSSSSSNDELIKVLTKSTQALIAGQTHHGNQINTISTDVAEMKKQMSQVVEFVGKFHEQGKLPSGTIPNPHFEQAKAVTTRSGKTLVNPPKPPKKVPTSTLEEEEDPATAKDQLKTSPPSHAKPDTQGNVSNSFNSVFANPSYSPLPFPSRIAKSKKDEAEKAILETFKKVQVNIPLLEAIKQIPKYAKFLKELCTTRRQTREKEVVKVSENVSAVLQRRMPEKCKDLGCFSIPCVIGTTRFENVMPYSVYETLGLGELKHDNVIIQLADRSNAYPKGLVEDVLVQVDELIFPADFYVLEMEEPSPTSTPLLLGRPFMRTARTKIDVYSGTLTMEFDGEVVAFNIFEAMRYPLVDFQSCFSIDILDDLAQKFMESMEEDAMASTIANGVGFLDDGATMPQEELTDSYGVVHLENVASLEATPFLSKSIPSLSIPISTNKPLTSVIQAPTLELKPLPNHLKYAYLGDKETLPVIISSSLMCTQEGQLVDMLKKHKTAIGWTLADIKGISPTTCVHRILLEEGAKPTREA
ncbi:uncharacterized protein LOC112176089 [Rosa chinensis]|uniref:uncharacterized protein LOC112176089 n=1 Tax=Rosa chinensis TaxID=74649 RepID=UPI000D08E8C4|nr:uncharacterized protein LOC112176089 [Rosa chinensis]XP_024169678.1 uncharacterized protein LOC112176089 [Rosa chinensis]XP_040366002.1 uncharacterized protein LOC112176089 [Rosa chinensis]